MIPFPQEHSIDMLPLRGKTKTAPRQALAQPAIAIYVCRSIHLTLKLTRLPRLSIFGTILIPGPPPGIGNWWFTQVEAFVQDNWRVSRRLTLDLGVRFYYRSEEHTSELQSLRHLV